MAGPAKVILCVDDEAIGLSVQKMLLESQGYRVITAQNGFDALLRLASENPDLVILDYFMPDMNGDVLARRIKTLRPDLPILLLSGYLYLPGEALDRVDKFLTKGGSPQALLDCVAELLARSGNPDARPLSAV